MSVLVDNAGASDVLARAEVASRSMADGAGASDAMTTTFYLGLLSWTADDSQQFNVDIELSGSLTVGVAVAAPPPIYGS